MTAADPLGLDRAVTSQFPHRPAFPPTPDTRPPPPYDDHYVAARIAIVSHPGHYMNHEASHLIDPTSVEYWASLPGHTREQAFVFEMDQAHVLNRVEWKDRGDGMGVARLCLEACPGGPGCENWQKLDTWQAKQTACWQEHLMNMALRSRRWRLTFLNNHGDDNHLVVQAVRFFVPLPQTSPAHNTTHSQTITRKLWKDLLFTDVEILCRYDPTANEDTSEVCDNDSSSTSSRLGRAAAAIAATAAAARATTTTTAAAAAADSAVASGPSCSSGLRLSFSSTSPPQSFSSAAPAYQRFRAHRAVLAAASPVFAAMLSTEMKEGQSQVIELRDSDPAAVKAALEYIYTGDVCEGAGCGMVVLGHKYDIAGLVEYASPVALGNLTAENVVREIRMLRPHAEDKQLGPVFEALVNKIHENPKLFRATLLGV